MIGVSDGGGDATLRAFTPTKRPGGRSLNEWARTVLESLAGSLSPAPRLQTVTVDNIEVLVIGVGRAPSLVATPEEGGLKYFLRIGDSTPAIPPYLISDLILGRRSHPEFEVKVTGWGDNSIIRFRCEVLNESMVAAQDVVVGIIYPGLGYVTMGWEPPHPTISGDLWMSHPRGLRTMSGWKSSMCHLGKIAES